MNNDIRSNYPKFVNPQGANKKTLMAKEVSGQMDTETTSYKPMADSMEVLGALGHAQVNMDNLNNGVKHSVEKYINDPIYAQNWVDYYDELIERGYNSEEALHGTDEFFSILKDKNIYS